MYMHVYSFRLLISALCERHGICLTQRLAGSLRKQVISFFSFSLMNYESQRGGGGAVREIESESRAGGDLHWHIRTAPKLMFITYGASST